VLVNIGQRGFSSARCQGVSQRDLLRLDIQARYLPLTWNGGKHISCLPPFPQTVPVTALKGTWLVATSN
jgi:hypothetical protein